MSDPGQALLDAGISPDAPVRVDGNLHRFRPPGDHGNNGWYAFRIISPELTVGGYGCFKRGIHFKFYSRDKSSMTPEQWKTASAELKRIEALRRAEEAANHARVRAECEILFAKNPAPGEHPYLTKKGVQAYGNLRVSTRESIKGWLAVPLQDESGIIHSAQFIADDGAKKFFYQGRIQGMWFQLSDAIGPLVICEGYATGASIHEATGWAVACAMTCGNMLAVAKTMRRLHGDRLIVIAADNDQFTEGNPGADKGRAAAKSVNGLFVMPEFGDEALANKPTDFNDLHRMKGLEAVRNKLQSCFPIHARPIGELVIPEDDDPTELLKHRYLCECGSLLINGPTGMGKSSFVLQCLALWANNLPAFGIKPRKALSSVLVQAENDDGDMAQMRDGICTGLKFDAEQRKNFFTRVLVMTSEGIVGHAFCREVVAPLLALHKPHLFAIDPANSFHGGDVKDNKDIGTFLRIWLKPLLSTYKTASVIVHHTNKPVVGREKSSWRNGEFAYAGSGASEWANWARAILSVQDTGQHGLYRLHAAKRGSRLAWRSGDEFLYDKLIGHSHDKTTIYWRDADETEIEGDNHRRPMKYESELLDAIEASSMTTTDWFKIVNSEHGIPKGTFFRSMKTLEKEGKVLKSKATQKWSKIIPKSQ